MSNVKYKCRVVGRMKVTNNCKNLSKGSPLDKWKLLPFGGRVPTLGTDWREILLGEADQRAQSHESVPVGETADFWPVSKFNTDSLPYRGILHAAGKNHER